MKAIRIIIAATGELSSIRVRVSIIICVEIGKEGEKNLGMVRPQTITN